MTNLLQDLRYGFRMLLKSPSVTIVAILALTLGIGATTAIFSVVNAVLRRPLPFDQPENLMLIRERSSQFDSMSVSYPNFLDWRDQQQVFEQIAAFRRDSYNLTGEGEPERVTGAQASAELFSVFRVTPALGRSFTAEEDQEGGSPVVILSNGLWKRRYGSNP